jgi:outer membrane protein assembly factor BamB
MLAACKGAWPFAQQTTSLTTSPDSPSLCYTGGAVRARNGAVRWTANLGKVQPILANDILYTISTAVFDAPLDNGPASRVSAVRASDGTTVWTYEVSPFPARIEQVTLVGDRLIVPTFDERCGLTAGVQDCYGLLSLVALRPSDGAVLWRSSPVKVDCLPAPDYATPYLPAPDYATPYLEDMTVADGQSVIAALHDDIVGHDSHDARVADGDLSRHGA